MKNGLIDDYRIKMRGKAKRLHVNIIHKPNYKKQTNDEW